MFVTWTENSSQAKLCTKHINTLRCFANHCFQASWLFSQPQQLCQPGLSYCIKCKCSIEMGTVPELLERAVFLSLAKTFCNMIVKPSSSCVSIFYPSCLHVAYNTQKRDLQYPIQKERGTQESLSKKIVPDSQKEKWQLLGTSNLSSSFPYCHSTTVLSDPREVDCRIVGPTWSNNHMG